MKNLITQSLILVLIGVVNSFSILANDNDSAYVSLFDRSIEELINQEVTIATKSYQKLSQTPSVVSVITAEEIKAMGYRELSDILETIPGFESSQTRLGSKPVGIRGVSDIRQGARILVMLDGTSYNDIMYGSPIFFGADFNLDAVKKIEVIRGPGSALYGRNAFSAVVNIITKKATTNNNIEVGVSGLPELPNDILSAQTSEYFFNTGAIRASFDIKKEEFNAHISAKYYTSDGTDSKYNNGEGGESVWNLTHDNIYLNANAEYKKLQIYGSYTQRNDGASTGIDDFLTNAGSEDRIATYSLRYSNDIASNTSISAKLYGRNQYRLQDYELASPNTTDPIEVAPDFWVPINAIYSEGGYAIPVFNAYTYGAEVELSFQLRKNNKLLIGLQGDVHGIKNATVRSNYNLETHSPIIDPSTSQQYSKDKMPLYEPGWIQNEGHDYQNVALYIQDVHYFTDNFSLTLGARLDLDSEVGESINPRAGLVWEPTKASTIKLLYGKAYIAPTPNEQYKIMGADMGNENLEEERIHTTELVIAYQFDKVYTQLSFYYNILDNLILQQYINDSSNIKSYYNTGQNISYGVEFDSKYRITSRLYGFANYSYNQSEDTKTIFEQTVVAPHANVSAHKFNIGLNTKIHEKLNWSVLLRYKSDIQKYLNTDPNKDSDFVSQDKVGDFFMLNSTILLTDLIKGFDFSIQGYNLLNTSYYYQDDTFPHQPAQPGIHFLLRASYKFNL